MNKCIALSNVFECASQCVENPGTGRLVDDPEISFMKYRVMVDYCVFGSSMRKRTALWFNIDPRLYGFGNKLCPGYPTCQAMSTPRCHGIAWESMPLYMRSSIPHQLSIQVARLMLMYYTEHSEALLCSSSAGRVEASMSRGLCYAGRVKLLEDLRRQRGGKKRGQQNPYYGRRVRKLFEDGVMYEGVVGTSDYDAKKLRSNVFEMIYRVEYEDSQIEDYSLQELQDILVE